MPNRSTSAWRRRVAVVSAGGLLALLAPAFGAAPAGAAAPVPFDQADFAGYGAGSMVHLGAVTAGSFQVAKADVAPANALVASKGLGPVSNVYGLPINRTASGGVSTNKADANASAVSAGVLQSPTTAGNINLTALAAAEAPPPSTATKSIPVNLQPLLSANLLHSTAHANYLSSNECFLGGNLTDAESDATNLNVVGSPGLVTTSPSAVSKNFSSTRLVPQTDSSGNLLGNAFGLASLNTQNLAPVNIPLAGGIAISINVGQWALEAAAVGAPGGAFFTYGHVPGASDSPIALAITTPLPAPLNSISIPLSAVVGPGGFDTHSIAGGALDALLRVSIGVPPSVSSSPPTATLAANGTSATAVADIVHVSVVGNAVADLRLGHMEAAARVPDGGIACTLHPTKTATPDPVTVGQNFVYNIGVPNPNACILMNVKITDVITAAKGIKFTVSQTNPSASVSPIATDPANSANNAVTIVFNNIGDIPPGGTGHAQIVVNIDPSSGTGIFTDKLHVDATCGVGAAGGSNKLINVAAPGDLILTAPTVGSGAVQGTLARTGGTHSIYVWLGGLGLLGFVAADRIRRRATGSSTK
jgi:hypothetical protein